MHCLVQHKTVKPYSCTKRYCVPRMKLLMSGDIEINPGPEQNVCDQTALSVGSTLLLNYRLRQLGLRPHDVSGAGDCLFRAVSHQLYGDSSHHLHIREVGVQSIRAHQEKLTEHLFNSIVNDPRSKITSLLPPAVSISHELRRQRRFATPLVKTNRFANSFIVKSAREALK